MTNPTIELTHMENHKGHLVPIESIRDIDIERDRVVRFIADDAIGLQEIIREWQTRTINNIQAFLDLSAARFNVRWGGEKGNIQFTTYDGRYMVRLAINDYIDFNEAIHIAQKLIEECLDDWSIGSRSEIRTLIGDAFSLKDGKLNAKKILELKKHKFDDPRWHNAMKAIDESIVIAGSKKYIRIYRKNEQTGKMEMISLDGANL